MTQKDIIEFIQNYMPIAVKAIEQSKADGHLQYAEDIYIKYNNEEKIANKFNCTKSEIMIGMTTSSFFTRVPFFAKWNYISKSGAFYCLNKGMKASDALDDLLNNSITVIDCILATHLAWYLCIRALLIKFHGDKDGIARFNDLFDVEKLVTLLQNHQQTKTKIKEFYTESEHKKRVLLTLIYNEKMVAIDICSLLNVSISYLKTLIKNWQLIVLNI